MKISLVSYGVLSTLLICNGAAQAAGNPLSLGETNFDLLQMDFSERIDALFSKTSHHRVAVQNGPAPIAYNYIVSKKQEKAIKISLGRMDVGSYRYEFRTTRNQEMIGVSVSFITDQDLRSQIIDEIDRTQKKNRVAVGALAGYPSVYRWESKERIIQFVAATAEKDNVYNVSIVSKRFECSVFPLESVFIGEDICLRKYPRN